MSAPGSERCETCRFWQKVEKRGPDDCWLWQGSIIAGGYGGFSVNNRTVGAHRYAVNAPKGGVVRHSCDNPSCVNPAHLLIGTQAQNIADRVARGRSAVGERNGQSALTNRQAAMVRQSTLGTRELGRQLGVHHSTISRVRRGLQHQAREG